MNFEQVVQEQLKKLKEEGLREGRAEGQKALERAEQGRHEAMDQARQCIADLCEVLGIELTVARQSDLEARDQAGLSALRAHLKAHRTWP